MWRPRIASPSCRNSTGSPPGGESSGGRAPATLVVIVLEPWVLLLAGRRPGRGPLLQARRSSSPMPIKRRTVLITHERDENAAEPACLHGFHPAEAYCCKP